MYCVDRKIENLLDEEAIHKLEREYEYRRAMSNYRDGLADFKSRDKSGLKAVETDGRFLFFDKTIVGEISLKKYLQYQADAFFNPKNDVRSIKIYDLDKAPESLHDIANEYDQYHNLGSTRLLNSLLDPIFCDKGNLENAKLLREYDMSPTRENFWNFVNDNTGETLHLSIENYDILRTMVIRDEGYGHGEQVKTAFLYGDGYEYDYDHKFDKINEEMSKEWHPVKLNALKEESKKIAVAILAKEYPDIRKSKSQENKASQSKEIPQNRPVVKHKTGEVTTKTIKKTKL